MARLRVLVGAILTAALVLAFAAPASATGGGTAKVRAFHNSPDTPAVDIYVSGAKALSDVTYGTLSATSRCPGTYNVQVKVAPSTASDPAALEVDVRLGKPDHHRRHRLADRRRRRPPAEGAARPRHHLPPPDPAAGRPHQPRR